MAEELLQAKNDYKKLGVNKVSGFFTCNPMLQLKYNYILDQKQFFVQALIIIQYWFDLYQLIKAKHGILDKNTYNINENGLYDGYGWKL